MAADRSKGMFLTFAILFFILGISNVLKPLQLLGEQTGFVLFGERLTGTANAIAGPLFGLSLFVYAFGVGNGSPYR